MKRETTGLLCAALTLGLYLVAAAPASARAWRCTQGHIAEIQNTKIVTPYEMSGWGTDFTQTDGTKNWVHMYLPGNGVNASRVKSFKVKFWSTDFWAWIDRVDVYNGNDKVYEAAVGWREDWEWETHEMDKKYIFRDGIGISMRVRADDGAHDVDPVQNRFAFGGFCVLFEDLP